MIGHLYRYPHPIIPDQYLYVGQGSKRDQPHRKGSSSFGRRFQKKFPTVELPKPIRWTVVVANQQELNEEETIAIFHFHTWCGYGGMNLNLPGSQDYKVAGKMAARLWGPDHQSRVGALGGRENVRSGHLARLRTSEHQSVAGKVGGRSKSEKKLAALKITNKSKTHEQRQAMGRKGGAIGGSIGGRKSRERGVGIFGMTPEEKQEAARKGGRACPPEARLRGNHTQKILGIGIFGLTPEQRQDAGKKGGKIGGPISGRKNVENGHLAKIRTPEHQVEAGRAAAAANRDANTGLWGLTTEQRAAAGRVGGRTTVERGFMAKAQAVSNHARWHTNRGVFNSKCKLCLLAQRGR